MAAFVVLFYEQFYLRRLKKVFIELEVEYWSDYFYLFSCSWLQLAPLSFA